MQTIHLIKNIRYGIHSLSSSSLFSTILLLSFFLNAFAQGLTPTPLTSRPTVKDRLALFLPYINSLKRRIVERNEVTDTWFGKNVCSFKGFTCAYLPDLEKHVAVAGVTLDDLKLTGRDSQLSLDGFINGFPDITYFRASSNNFTGTIPKIDTNIIPYLYELDLSRNKLSGPFPNEVLGAKNLTYLNLRVNQFSGAIPQKLFEMDIGTIYLSNNSFQQELPSNLGSTPAWYIRIDNNKLTGPIPPSIGQAQLREFNLSNNQLTGSLPPEIGSLKHLTHLDVGKNKLAGPIPNSFRYLKNIRVLKLGNNSFYGTIPDDFCKIMTLESLHFANNFFTGVGPECRKLIDNKFLDVDNNCIVDLPNQKAKAECEKFMSQPMKEDPRMSNYIPCDASAGKKA